MRSGTPSRGNPPVSPVDHGKARFVVVTLTSLAVMQGLFFLLPTSSIASRLVGIALALGTLLAARVMQPASSARVAAMATLAMLIFANFTLHLVNTAPRYSFRVWQVAILLGYVCALLAALTSLARAIGFRQALIGWGSLAVLLLGVEAAIGGPDNFSGSVGRVEWEGTTPRDSVFGVRFAPNSVVKSLYPDNPRDYFDEPNDLQKRWTLSSFEGSKAQLVFAADSLGVMRVNITEAPGRETWHIALVQAPIRIAADGRYEVRFRVRADSPRTVFVLAGQAHEPWKNLGLFREIRVDTSWQAVTQTFRASESDQNARLYFDLGGDVPSVELSAVSMREVSTNRVIEAAVQKERSVTYRMNSEACRGVEAGNRDSLANSLRILSIGDGSSLGVGVHERDTYASRLQVLLNGAPGQGSSRVNYEVLNCGAWGSSTDDQRRIFARVVRAYAPDVVVLSVSPDDYRDSPDEGVPQFGNPEGKFARLFRVWGLVSTAGEADVPPPDYSPMVAGVREMATAAQTSGAKAAVMLFRSQQSDDWARLDSALSAGLRDLNVPILDLGPTLLPFGERALMVDPRVDVHPNDLAHRLASEALQKFLSEQGLLNRRSQPNQ